MQSGAYYNALSQMPKRSIIHKNQISMTEQKESVLPEMENEGEDIVKSETAAESAAALPEKNEMEDIASTTGVCEEESSDVPESVESYTAENENEDAKSNMTRLQIVERLEALINSAVEEVKDEIENLKQNYYKLRKQEVDAEKTEFEANAQEDSETQFAPSADTLEERLKGALQIFKEKKAKFLAELEETRAKNLERKQTILDEMAKIVNDSDNINKRYNEFQQLQQAFKEITDIPASAVNQTWKNFQHSVEQFYDMLKINKELRDYDFKKNLEQKTAICKAAEALTESKDIIAAFKELQRLHDEWRNTGPVERELREQIWTRFKDASTIISKRYQAHFEAIKEQERENEEAKIKLCEKIEAINTDELKNFQTWEEKTKEIVDIQSEWKKIGYTSRKKSSQLYERFRNACDIFFKKKSEYYKAVKSEFAKNLEQKRALCEKAEALKESTEWQKTTEKYIALQKEWKTVGAVPRKYSDALWKRFISACDYFFEQKAKETAGQMETEKANLAAKQAIIEKIMAIDSDTEGKDAENELRNLIAEWNGIGFVPYKEKDKLNKAFKAALDKQFEKFNIQNRNARLSAYASTIKEISGGNASKLHSERERLLRTYDRMKAELQTYENNMGFFSISSKQGNSIVKEIERKIKKLKDDMQLIVQKIEMIDENMK